MLPAAWFGRQRGGLAAATNHFTAGVRITAVAVAHFKTLIIHIRIVGQRMIGFTRGWAQILFFVGHSRVLLLGRVMPIPPAMLVAGVFRSGIGRTDGCGRQWMTGAG